MYKKKRNKFSIADRERAVLLVLREGHSYCSVARMLSTSDRLVSRWVSSYKLHGISGLSLKNHIRYSGDFKLSLLKDMLENHLSLQQASAKYHISDGLISGWRRKYEQYGESSLYAIKQRGRPPKMKKQKNTALKQERPSDPYQELLDENLRLRIENEYLKKLQALTQKKKGQKPSRS